VAGRASVWSDERVIERAGVFVAAADETWRLQRGSDPECRHFQAMADQGHYGGGGGTRQGIYLCAPSGKLLASINSLNAQAVLDTLERGLAAWEALPDEQRWLSPEDRIEPEHRWEFSYPARGLVLTSVNRDLPADGDPNAEPARPSNRDHVWFAPDEARRWLPANPRPGAVHRLPAPLVERLARFHLVDNVRGQTLPFAREEVDGSWVQSEVVGRDGDRVHLRLSGTLRAVAEGPWLMGSNDWTPPREYPRGIETGLLGTATFDLGRQAFTAFEAVALGRRWGSGWLNGRRAEEAGPIGFVLSLSPDTPAERVPPAFVDLYRAAWIVRPDDA
jgi:hypothetical protein